MFRRISNYILYRKLTTWEDNGKNHPYEKFPQEEDTLYSNRRGSDSCMALEEEVYNEIILKKHNNNRSFLGVRLKIKRNSFSVATI